MSGELLQHGVLRFCLVTCMLVTLATSHAVHVDDIGSSVIATVVDACVVAVCCAAHDACAEYCAVVEGWAEHKF